MANATLLPTSTNLFIGQFSKKSAASPKLSAAISATATTITVTTPLYDNTGTVVTGAFLLGIKKSNGWTEVVWVPASAVSVDGLTYTGCVRGIKPDGYDYTAGSASFADTHNADELVFCVIPAVIPELMRKAIQGIIATGGADFIIGTDALGTVTVSRSTGVGTYVGWLRWYTTTSKVQYSNNGSAWVAIDDSAASVIFKVSATDTTASYAENKIIAGTNITITKTGTGANETLVIATSLAAAIDEHEIYTPAYLTGGGSAESNPALWDSISDGSFRITIDGTAYNVDAIDFTPQVGGDMDDMAGVIQAAIRVATGSTETCVWDTDHFLITSADTTSSSEVSVTDTSTGTVGTDISGAGASDWMDSDSGNGVATGAVLSESADAGKTVALAADGNIDHIFRGDAVVMVAGETLDGTATPVAVYVSDGSNSRTAGRVYKADADDLTNMAVRFFGFVKTSVGVGETVVVYTKGVVSGFTGLTQGVDYYLSTTAGAISKTITSNPAVLVGRAKSATELEIMQNKISVQSYTSTATSNGNTDVVISIGFRPSSLISFAVLDIGGLQELTSYGQWNNGTQNCIWERNVQQDSGTYTAGCGTDTDKIGYLRETAASPYTNTITVNAFTDNSITIRHAANQIETVGLNLLIFS